MPTLLSSGRIRPQAPPWAFSAGSSGGTGSTTGSVGSCGSSGRAGRCRARQLTLASALHVGFHAGVLDLEGAQLFGARVDQLGHPGGVPLGHLLEDLPGEAAVAEAAPPRYRPEEVDQGGAGRF